MNYRKNILILIAVSTVLRLFLSSSTELSSDEVYYWTYALKVKGNYFDHPPLVALLIRLTTANLALHSELAVRLGAVLSAAISTWIIFKIGTFLNNLQTGWYAALLYTASLYCSITAGAYILPDSPQLIFWLTSLLVLIKISRSGNDISKSNQLWCLFGLTAGLCIMCKVHGAFLWLGAVMYVLAVDRDSLKHKGIYLAGLITLIIISPIIIWNIQNDFITYKFHAARITPVGSGFHLTGFLKELLGEVTNNNPVNFFLVFSAIVLTLKGKLPIDKKEVSILLVCTLPLILSVMFISLFRETYHHWSAPAYTTLLLLSAVRLASHPKISLRNIPGVITAGLIYMVFVGALQTLTINYFPGTLSLEKEGLKTGTLDLTLDSYGWKEASKKFDSLYKSDLALKTMRPGAPVIATNWDTAAAIEFYITSNTKQEVIGIGGLSDLHQYYLTNKYKKKLKEGDYAYFIVPSNTFNYRTLNEVTTRFRSYDVPLIISQYRGGLICRYIYVYRMLKYKG